jgi:hypothetical protein
MISYNNNCIRSASDPVGGLPDGLLLLRKSKGSMFDIFIRIGLRAYLPTHNWNKVQKGAFVLKIKKKLKKFSLNKKSLKKGFSYRINQATN